MADLGRQRRQPVTRFNMRQILISYGIYPDNYKFSTGFVEPKPRNWGELLQAMENPREEAVSEEAYTTYNSRASDITGDPSIMRLLFPIIQGECNDPAQEGVQFANIAPFPCSQDIIPPSPAFYYGEKPESLGPHIHQIVGKYIIPSKNSRHPVLPNFLLELAYDTPLSCVEDIALYDGIHGARGVHALQEYVNSGSGYDGKAYTIVAILGQRYLGLYTVHLTKPFDSTESPKYYLNLLRNWNIRESLETFQKAIHAYRNMRDFMRDERRRIISIANASASLLSAGNYAPIIQKPE
jgi:hypothetical protein